MVSGDGCADAVDGQTHNAAATSAGAGDRKIHRSATKKFTMVSVPTASVFATIAGESSSERYTAVRTTLPPMATRPVATLYLANRTHRDTIVVAAIRSFQVHGSCQK